MGFPVGGFLALALFAQESYLNEVFESLERARLDLLGGGLRRLQRHLTVRMGSCAPQPELHPSSPCEA